MGFRQSTEKEGGKKKAKKLKEEDLEVSHFECTKMDACIQPAVGDAFIGTAIPIYVSLFPSSIFYA